ILANRLSYVFGFQGPSESIGAACAASLVAMHHAKATLRSGESDYAIVAGVSLNIHPWKYISFSKSRMLSPDGQCKTFDQAANGYVPGEGTGVLLLQRVEDALRADNHIYGILKGSAVNHGGQTRSITAPRVEAQQAVITAAYTEAGISPDTITYVEAHGTGTSLGDPIEVEALNQTFQTYTDDTHFCLLGSVKTNIGHLEAAAGVAGVIKVLLMLRHGQIPPSLHIKTLNPIINFSESPFRVVTELCDWQARKPELPLRAGVSSFGFGGVNSHVVLESFTQENSAHVSGVEEETPEQNLPGTLFLLSAKSPNALKGALKSWRGFVESDAYATSRLDDLCATLITGRGHFPYRYGQYVTRKAELQTFLDQDLPEVSKQTTRSWCVRAGKFTWEHTTRMQRLIAQEPLFHHHLERVQQAVSTLNIPQALHQAAWPEPTKQLKDFMMSYAYLAALMDSGFAPMLVTGEGSGIWVSLALSGILTLNDTLAVLSHQTTLHQLTPLRPTLPFYDPVNHQMLKPYHIDDVYLHMLTEDLHIPPEILQNSVKKARLLHTTQFTFKKYLEEWGLALKESSTHDLEQLLYDDVLISSAESTYRRTQTLLMMVISGSLLQLNQKWRLQAGKQLIDDRFYELLDLVIDGVLPKSGLIELLNQDNPDLEALAATLNSRQDALNPDNPYELLRRRSQEVSILPNLSRWIKQARKSQSSLPALNNAACLDLGQLSGQTFSEKSKKNLALRIPEPMDYAFRNTLLQLWLHGVDINWDLLFPEGSFSKVQLPTYSFDRSSFWLTKTVAADTSSQPELSPLPNTAETASAPPQRDPLQQRDSQGLQYTRHVSLQESNLRHHIITGAPIIPGACLLEWGVEAVQRAVQQPVNRLRNIIIKAPGIIEADVAVEIEVQPEKHRFVLKTATQELCEGEYEITA
ncbi:MAG: hypothetical protein GY952_05920, partial [Rhodobacteraceae bacterium]|nr:hypothetical protein [Paracoccaceae bacterium]